MEHEHLPLHLRPCPRVCDTVLIRLHHFHTLNCVQSTECGELLVSCFHSLVHSLDYLWHCALPGPCLVVSHHPSNIELQISIEYGDCIMDERVALWLTRRLTKEIPGTVAHLEDGDGEFMLIEAGEKVPSWLTPENSKGRVWLREGRVHIVGKPRDPNGLLKIGATVDYDDGLELVRRCPECTLASEEVDCSVWKWIERFPEEAVEYNHHHVRVLVPSRVAAFLQQYPQWVGLLVQAFHGREVEGNQWTKNMHQVLSMDTLTMSAVRVRMTRYLYAQLMSSGFQPPKKFVQKGYFAGIGADDTLRKAAMVGVRLCCGLEILLQQQQVVDLNNIWTQHCVERQDNWMQQFEQIEDDDDESWMYVSESDVDKLLKSWDGVIGEEDDLDRLAQAEHLVDSVKDFLTLKESDIGGVEEEKLEENVDTPIEFDVDVLKTILEEHQLGSDREEVDWDEEMRGIMLEMDEELGYAKNGSLDDDGELLKHLMESLDIEHDTLLHTGPVTTLLQSLSR